MIFAGGGARTQATLSARCRAVRVGKSIGKKEMTMVDTAERASTYVPSGAGTSYWMPGGEQATIKMSSGDTYGAYAVVELTIPPQMGPPPHVHHTMEETFYLLDGEMEFVADGTTTTASAGSLVRIPQGALRGYRNVGAEPARVLVFFLPGGFEGFLEEMGQPVTDASPPQGGQPDAEKIVATAAKYGCEIPPPTGQS
jgi:quercetin dioxygenase-like cupin family protein